MTVEQFRRIMSRARSHKPSRVSAPKMKGYTSNQSSTERRYNAEVLHGAGRFEAVALYLPSGGRYTPDFMTVDDGVITFHEVKGAYRLQSQGRAFTAFHEAASAFPFWRFVWAQLTPEKTWSVKVINSDVDISTD